MTPPVLMNQVANRQRTWLCVCRDRSCCLSAMIAAGALLLASSFSGQTRSAAAAESSDLDAARDRAGVDPERLAVIDEIVAEGLQFDRLRGCVVVVGCRGQIVHHRAYGLRALKPDEEPMTIDTVFDLASLTKPVATATSVMILAERGQIGIDAPVNDYLPEFTGDAKETITIRQLLTHQGGLIADNRLSDYFDGPEKAWERITGLEPVAEPGSKFIYSDVGFIVLGRLVQQMSGQSLDAFARQRIFAPLGMAETRFNPPAEWHSRCAPTEQHAGEWLRGTVHDPRSREIGGVAGHAGLFSTAADLSKYCQMLLNEGQLGEAQILRPETIEAMTAGQETTGGLRSLGWDKRSVYSSNRGDLMSPAAFGHGGFTGTAMWIDPGADLFVVFLSSRLHPDGEGSVNRLAGRIATVAAAAVGRR